MACDISAGRNEVCKDSVGGLDAIYFINYGDNPYSGITFDATNTDVIETLNGTPSSVSAYKYELKADACTFEQNITPSRETGTTVFEQVLNVTLKKQDLGISIVVSGLYEEIQKMASKMDIRLHTIHHSLGVFGKKELLPSDQILELTTMCGHHCISPQSVEYYLQLIREGKISVEKAAEKLKKPCVCGIFNTSRAVNILNRFI